MTATTNLLEAGIYTVPQAAYLLEVSQQKVRGWLAGYPRRDAGPIVRNEIGWSGRNLALSFRNLMEMRFIAYFEREGVRFMHIRSIMDEVRTITQQPHPFATNIVFKTDGKRILGEVITRATGKVLYDPKTKNFELLAVVYDSLKEDIVYDFEGHAMGWYPRRRIAPNVIVHPKFAFGHPILRTSRIPTCAVFDAVQAQGQVRAVAEWFELPTQQVKEAVTFETQLRKAA